MYTCDFAEANGTVAELVWDAQYGQNCSQMANPIICGSTAHNVPSQFNKDWIDLQGGVHAASDSATIGANRFFSKGSDQIVKKIACMKNYPRRPRRNGGPPQERRLVAPPSPTLPRSSKTTERCGIVADSCDNCRNFGVPCSQELIFA